MFSLSSRTVVVATVVWLAVGRIGSADEPTTPLKPHQVDIQAKIEALRRRLTDHQLSYIDAALKNGGEAPTLNLNDTTRLRVGSVGRPVIAGRGFSVDEVLGKSELMIGGGRLRLEGVSTKGIPVGAFVPLNDVVVVVAEIESQKTAAGGKRTIPRLVAVSNPRVNETLVRIIELNRFRDWTDAEGTFLGTAKFVQLKEGQVDLQRMDDSETVTVALDSLTKDDQKWINDELKRQAEEKRAASAKAAAAAKKARR